MIMELCAGRIKENKCKTIKTVNSAIMTARKFYKITINRTQLTLQYDKGNELKMLPEQY